MYFIYIYICDTYTFLINELYNLTIDIKLFYFDHLNFITEIIIYIFFLYILNYLYI